MTSRFPVVGVFGVIALCTVGCVTAAPQTNLAVDNYTLDYDAALNPVLQAKLEVIDADLRSKHGMTTEQTAVGVLDLNRGWR